MKPTIDIDKIQPLGERLVVRKYTKPERIGKIWTNPAWRTDNSRALWELAKPPSEAAAVAMGAAAESGERMVELSADDILITAPNRGVFIGRDEENREVYVLDANVVAKMIPWTETENEDDNES